MNIIKTILAFLTMVATIIVLNVGCVVAVDDPPPPQHEDFCEYVYYSYSYSWCCAETYDEWYYGIYTYCIDYDY